MSYQLLRESKPVARKNHTCIWCGELIPKGEQHVHERSIYYGHFQNHRWHKECLDHMQAHWDPHDECFEPYMNERPEKGGGE